MHLKSLILISLVFIIFIVNANVNAQNDLSGQEVLAISKMSGACGILNSMIYFQNTTKMPGGDEFVKRFWGVEAARLGFSMQEYSEAVKKSIFARGSILAKTALSRHDFPWHTSD
ncbi:MAG: hypothetical protein IPP22_01185 [Nitrosomonas sp.]|nr:hypothetical protein [Nitrosomonas sp.]